MKLLHENKSCFKKPCRNSAHWVLRDDSGRTEIKSTELRINVMRQLWHGLTN